MKIDLSRFREIFLQESAEHLEAMERGLLELDCGEAGPELLHSIFRAAHSIKGSAGMLGFTGVVRFTHALESLLDALREGRVQTSPGLNRLLLSAGDMLKEMLSTDIDPEAVPPAAEEIIKQLDLALVGQALGEGIDAHVTAGEPPMSSAGRGTHQFDVIVTPSEALFESGTEPLLLLRDLRDLGSIVSVEADTSRLPDLADLDSGKSYLSWKLRLKINGRADDIRDVFLFVDDQVQVDVKPVLEEVAVVAVKAVARPATIRESNSIRVATGKVDQLIDLVGELIIAQAISQAETKAIMSQLAPEAVATLGESMAVVERRTRELQERVMAIRMLPVSTVFGRYPRLVHDIAASTGKQIRLHVSGEETELDKSVVEQLGDPLTHLIRNSADHGLETPEDRRAAGKPEEGAIHLRAFHQGGNVIIEVADDGRGLDTARIRAKAIERGLLRENEERSEEEIRMLIFEPGFSTRDEVSDLSGRGVGMDVVRRNVQNLNGAVSLSSEVGRGTTVRLRLPLTLAILDGLLVRVGEQTFVVPLTSIVESVRPQREHLAAPAGCGELVTVRGEPLPLLRLGGMFGITDAIADPSQGIVVIVENGAKKHALLVDELLGQQQVVIKSLEKHFRKVEGTLGATILGNGRAVLILDIAGLTNGGMKSCSGSKTEK